MIETGIRKEVTEAELLQEMIDELRRLRREVAGYKYLFTVSGEEVEEFERDIVEGQVESLQLKFQQHFVLLTEKVHITEELNGWKLDDLRVTYLVIKETLTELVVYGKDKPMPADYRLEYDSGLQTITTATAQPGTIGTYPPIENYPNIEPVRERTQSELYPHGRNAPVLYVVNDGPGNLYVLSSTEGIAWGGESLVRPAERFAFHNVYALGLRTDVDNTKYRASEYPILPSRITEAIVYTTVYDFSATINAGARSPDTNITGLYSNKTKIVGVAISSENDTDWRVKFYSEDTFDGTGYDSNTFIGNVEITILTADATGNYVGDDEMDLYYVDTDTTKELHVILENFGANNSKAYLTVLYVNVE